MKKQLLRFITDNRDCSLVNIYDKFSNDFSTHIILDTIALLEKESEIILVHPYGYRILNKA